MKKKRELLVDEDITIELLKDTSITMAKIVQQYGDLYLPIFIRVLKEIEKQKSNQSYKEIALQILVDES